MSNEKLIVEAHTCNNPDKGKGLRTGLQRNTGIHRDIRLKTKGRLQAVRIYRNRILTNK